MSGALRCHPLVTELLFASGSDDFDLIDVPLDGSDVRTLLASARSETRPTWSPTGKQLSYVTNARGKPEIWTRSVEEDWTRPLLCVTSTEKPSGSRCRD